MGDGIKVGLLCFIVNNGMTVRKTTSKLLGMNENDLLLHKKQDEGGTVSSRGTR